MGKMGQEHCLVALVVVQLQLCACETVAAEVLGAEIHPPARWSVKRALMAPLERQRDVPKDW